jgi:hypothetical protein
MPQQNLVSATLTDTDQTAVLTAITTIKNKLPFLITLTTDQRKSLPKMGDNSTPFVDKAYQFASQNTDKLGADFGMDDYTQDYELFQQLQPIVTAMSELSESLSDTELALGSDLMVRSNVAYGLMKVFGKASGSFDDLRRDMGARFARGPRKPKSPPTP